MDILFPKMTNFFQNTLQMIGLKLSQTFLALLVIQSFLKKKNYLFVDGRYTIQAKKEAGKNFQIIDFHKIINCNLFKNLSIGFDPKVLYIYTNKEVFL